VPPLATGGRFGTESAVISARHVAAQAPPWVLISPDRRSPGMSALGHKRSFSRYQANVRFAPKAVIQAWGD
jgi:hypothetical protein